MSESNAFPEIKTNRDLDPPETYSEGGLTKREYFAVKLMAGFMSDARNLTALIDAQPEAAIGLHRHVAMEAVRFADALCSQLKLDPTKEKQLLQRISKLEKDLSERNGS